eukprot:COSAG02_NODE_3995_length_5939_cov_3.184621_5_plen_168_part_00
MTCVDGECSLPLRPPGPPPPPPGFPAAESFAEVYGAYLRQPAIDAIFLYPWDTGYEGNGTEKGSITWVEGKPVITGRVSLWQGGADCAPKGTFGDTGCRNTTQVANFINSLKPDPTRSAGYSVVPVNVWTTVGDVASVQEVVAHLAPHIQVVAADVFVELVRNTVKH